MVMGESCSVPQQCKASFCLMTLLLFGQWQYSVVVMEMPLIARQ
jgi:hypothetical protein